MCSFIFAPTPDIADNDETETWVYLHMQLDQGGGASLNFFNMFLDALLVRFRFVREAMRPKTDRVSTFADVLKAQSTSLVTLRIVSLIFKEWEEVADIMSHFGGEKNMMLFSPPNCAALPSPFLPQQ